MPIIYKITNDINGKVYIGKTVRSLEDRIRDHLDNTLKEGIKERPLYRAINKYGQENFTATVIEECNLGEEDEREIYCIEQYDSYRNGYNATLGGDGRRVADYNLIHSLFLEGKCVSKIREETGYDFSTIRNALLNNGIDDIDVKRGSLKNSMQPVIMLDKETEEELLIFECINDVKYYFGISKAVHIREVCIGTRKSAYGYKWKFLDRDILEDDKVYIPERLSGWRYF